MLITNENFLFYTTEKKNISCSKTGYIFKFVRLVETVTYGTIGKGTGRHQEKRCQYCNRQSSLPTLLIV